VTTLRHHTKNLYVHYLCELLTYSHQIFSARASDMDVPNDRFTSGLTYFSRSQRSKCKKFLGNYGDTDRKPCTQTFIILLLIYPHRTPTTWSVKMALQYKGGMN